MSVKRIVDTSLWSNVDLVNSFSAEDKYFMLYILTNRHVRQCGIYKLPKKFIAFEMGYSLETIESLLDRFENKYKVIVYDNTTNEIAILSYLKHSIVKGGKPVYDCLNKDFSDVINKDLIDTVYKYLFNHFRISKTLVDIGIEEVIKLHLGYTINDNDNDNDNDSTVGDSLYDSCHDSLSDTNSNNMATVLKTYEEEIGPVSKMLKEELELYLKELSLELILKAIAEASTRNVKKWKYIKAILDRCILENIRTIKEFENRRQKAGSSKEPNIKKSKYEDVYRN